MGPTSDSLKPVGKPVDRVDGRLKVTGHATYAAEAPIKGCVHAVIVQSTIAKGKITALDASAAEQSPGVLAVLTHEKCPKIDNDVLKMLAEKRIPLGDNEIHYAGQHIAVVVAEQLDQALYAAKLVKVTYAEEKPVLLLDDPAAKKETPKQAMGNPLQVEKGDVTKALAAAGVKTITATYNTPIETHNPMEMSATVAQWDGDDKLTVWDATQAVIGRRHSTAVAFGLKDENVRILCPFVGGGFGCKGDQWMHTLLAVAAAKQVQRPVKLMLTRAQMFTSCGHRPTNIQTLTLGATADGKLVAIDHAVKMDDADTGKHIEPSGHGSSAVMYTTPNLKLAHEVTRTNVAPATFMRAPGETRHVRAGKRDGRTGRRAQDGSGAAAASQLRRQGPAQ